MMFRDDQLIFRCFECKKNYKRDFNKELIKRFGNIYEFCNKDVNKFILHMNTWIVRKDLMFHQILPDKEFFYSSLNMEKITDVDYRHAKRVFKNLSNRNLGDYHDLYVQSDTLLLADVFENFRNKCIKIYELDPAHFLSATRLAWKACLKRTEIMLELLTDVDMLLMVKNGIKGEICHATHRYAKANNKYLENYDENKESSYLQYLDASNLYGWEISQNCL